LSHEEKKEVAMPALLRRYATPFITGFFLVSFISGAFLFFHVGQGWFHEMHEWLSMVLVIPFVLHLWKHWKSFVAYFKGAPMALALAISIVAAAFYMLPDESPGRARAGGPPQFQFTSTILKNKLEDVAPLLGLSPDALVTNLKNAGFAGAQTKLPLNQIALTSGKDEGALVSQLLSGRAR
jgi:hypothetical protein